VRPSSSCRSSEDSNNRLASPSKPLGEMFPESQLGLIEALPNTRRLHQHDHANPLTLRHEGHRLNHSMFALLIGWGVGCRQLDLERGLGVVEALTLLTKKKVLWIRYYFRVPRCSSQPVFPFPFHSHVQYGAVISYSLCICHREICPGHLTASRSWGNGERCGSRRTLSKHCISCKWRQPGKGLTWRAIGWRR
jgi:hypothetical protein